MTKLTIGIGEDFPVEEKTERRRDDSGCRHRHHHHHHDRHERWHRWMREHFWGADKNKDKK